MAALVSKIGEKNLQLETLPHVISLRQIAAAGRFSMLALFCLSWDPNPLW